MKNKYDFIIVGCGIMGLTIAYHLAQQRKFKILILEKEHDTGFHASGRNSGVLHAGFYYTADSLKAKFTVAGNRWLKNYCQQKDLPINQCGKLVVATNEEELSQLYELERRGKINDSNIALIDEQAAEAIEPNVRTFKKALHSPDTASVDPKEVCFSLKNDLLQRDVKFLFNCHYLKKDHNTNTVITSNGDFTANKVINCAGLYADKIAHDFGFGKKYCVIPFKGLYLKYTKNKTDIRTNIYPVPNLKNPFLGVHFTKTVHGDIKIGPTAIPAFWRENYSGLSRFRIDELLQIGYQETRLFIKNSFGFRSLAFEEMSKYNKNYFIGLATRMVKTIDPQGFTDFTQPGIRAQLLDLTSLKLVQDFVVEADQHSVHLLNAVSPAFTCSFPFAEYVVDQFILK